MDTDVQLDTKEEKGLSEVLIDGKRVSEMNGTEILTWSEKLRHYLENHISEFSSKPTSLIRQGGISFRVIFDENRWFWDSVRSGSWEPETYEVFDQYLSSDAYYFDIGAWIGPTVLYAAHLSQKVFAFEPDPVAFQELKKNIELNQSNPAISNVELYQEAIAMESGSVELGTKSEGGDSLSSVLLSDEKKSWEVPSITASKMLERADIEEDKVFCKIDIEGFEYQLIPEMQSLLTRPDTTLYISLHPQFLWNTIKQSPRWNIFGVLRSRAHFIQAHRRILNALNEFQLFYTNGRPFKQTTELFKAMVTGSFPNGIVAVKN